MSVLAHGTASNSTRPRQNSGRVQQERCWLTRSTWLNWIASILLPTRFCALHRPIDRMIANAGIMACPLERNSRGTEMQLATNYVGHAVLISRLASAILEAEKSRVIVLTSSGHHFSGIREDVNFEHDVYDKWTAYGQSKTASALLALKVHSAMSASGTTALAVHPGFIQTELMRYLSKEDYAAMKLRTDIELPTTRTYKTVEQGARDNLMGSDLARTGRQVQLPRRLFDCPPSRRSRYAAWDHAMGN